jgi:hypothetical protein
LPNNLAIKAPSAATIKIINFLPNNTIGNNIFPNQPKAPSFAAAANAPPPNIKPAKLIPESLSLPG